MCVRVCRLWERKREWDRLGVYIGYVKGRERNIMGGYACMLCERKRERGTVWVGVCVGYMKGREG